MKVREAMTPNVFIANPQNTIQEVARVMKELDCGIIPVGDDDRLVGMVSDRDIALRAVAAGQGPETRVADVMSREVKYCYDDEDLAQVTINMGNQQLRRLPVLNRSKRLIGILSLGDIATAADIHDTSEALTSISRRGGRHSQSSDGMLL